MNDDEIDKVQRFAHVPGHVLAPILRELYARIAALEGGGAKAAEPEKRRRMAETSAIGDDGRCRDCGGLQPRSDGIFGPWHREGCRWWTKGREKPTAGDEAAYWSFWSKFREDPLFAVRTTEEHRLAAFFAGVAYGRGGK